MDKSANSVGTRWYIDKRTLVIIRIIHSSGTFTLDDLQHCIRWTGKSRVPDNCKSSLERTKCPFNILPSTLAGVTRNVLRRMVILFGWGRMQTWPIALLGGLDFLTNMTHCPVHLSKITPAIFFLSKLTLSGCTKSDTCPSANSNSGNWFPADSVGCMWFSGFPNGQRSLCAVANNITKTTFRRMKKQHACFHHLDWREVTYLRLSSWKDTCRFLCIPPGLVLTIFFDGSFSIYELGGGSYL